MPEDPSESTFMTAAEKQVDQLRKAVRHSRVWNWALAFVVVILAAVIGVLSVYVIRVNTIAHDVRQGAVQGCEAGNSFRAADLSTWYYIVSLSPAPRPGSPEAARQRRFIAYIRHKDMLRNCTQQFGAATQRQP